MRLIAFIEYAAVVIGAVAVVAGQYFALPRGFHLGLFLIGAGIALGGLESLFTRRMGFRLSEDGFEAYAGPPALIVGLMALAVGAALIASAYLLADARWHSAVHYLTRRPAPALIVAGLLLIGAGVLMMFNPQGRIGAAWTLLVHLPLSVLGLVLIAAGVAGIARGVWEWLEPQAFDSFTRGLPRKLAPDIF